MSFRFFPLIGYYKILSIVLHAIQLFSCSVLSDSLQPCRLQHARLPCPPPAPGGCLNSCPLSWWCHPTILSSVITFSWLQSFPTSGSFLVSRLFRSGGQSTGASALAPVLPMNIPGWSPLGSTGLTSLQCCTVGPFYLVKFELEYNCSTVLLVFCCVTLWISHMYTYTPPFEPPFRTMGYYSVIKRDEIGFVDRYSYLSILCIVVCIYHP